MRRKMRHKKPGSSLPGSGGFHQQKNGSTKMGYDSSVERKAPSAPRPQTQQAHTMSLFIPPNQLQDMLDAEVGQALCGRANIGKIVALSALQHSPQQHHMQQSDNWLDDNWLDDNWL